MITRSTALAGVALAAAACSSDSGTNASVIDENIDTSGLGDGPAAVIDPATIPRGEVIDFGPAPDVPDGPLSAEVAGAVALLYGQPLQAALDDAQREALATIASSGDPRLAWLISDHLRVNIRLASTAGQTEREFLELNDLVEAAASELTGQGFPRLGAWNPLTSALIGWDIPAPPDYLAGKRNIYTPVESAWEALMTDNSVVDWRIVSWGGVLIDNRPFDTTDDPCNCIPAIDNPTTLTAAEGTWVADDAVVFGVVINGEARAYPRQIMEVREMVNDTLGGRDFAMPYCTLCGAAQVWFTDDLPNGSNGRSCARLVCCLDRTRSCTTSRRCRSSTLSEAPQTAGRCSTKASPSLRTPSSPRRGERGKQNTPTPPSSPKTFRSAATPTSETTETPTARSSRSATSTLVSLFKKTSLASSKTTARQSQYT